MKKKIKLRYFFISSDFFSCDNMWCRPGDIWNDITKDIKKIKKKYFFKFLS